MKVILNEKQYNLVENLSEAMNQKNSKGYGLELIKTNSKVGTRILLDLETDAGSQFDLATDEGKAIYTITSVNGFNIIFQRKDNSQEYIYDFTNFDNGSITLTKTSSKKIKTPQDFPILSYNKVQGNKIVGKIFPKSDDPNKQADDDAENIKQQKEDFINKLNGFSVGDTFEFVGGGDYEFKILKKTNKGMSLDPISKSMKSESGRLKLLYSNVSYDMGSDAITIKIYDGEKSDVIKDITNVKQVSKSDNKSDDNLDDSAELDEIKGLIAALGKGQVFKIGEHEFIVTSNSQSNGTGFKPKDDKARDYILNSIKKVNEAKGSLNFFIKTNMVTEKDGKLSITGDVWNNNEYAGTYNLDDISPDSISASDTTHSDIEDDKDSKKKSKTVNAKKDRERKERRERAQLDKERVSNMRGAAKLIKNNPRLIRAIKKGVIPAKDVLKRVEKRLNMRKDKEDKKSGDGDNGWTSKFKSRTKVEFDLEHLESSNMKKQLDLRDNGNVASVEGKSANGRTVFLKKTKTYKIVLNKELAGDEYGGKIEFYRKNGTKGEMDIEIIVKDYSAL